jgi:hypothetical protein
MALVLKDRVQEAGTPNTTVSFTLTGAVAGFQSFTVIGNGNTTYYSATDALGNWEAGIGTYSTTGPTLTRTTILSSSNSGSAVTFSGAVNIFVTYPSEKSVNLNASGNVSPLGTISSGTWQGATVGVTYGGTGVTTSSGANSVVLRDTNANITINRLNQGTQTITASGSITNLTVASEYNQNLVGVGGQTFRLPDATTLSVTTAFQFNNNASGPLTITDFATATVGAVPPGGAASIALLDNSTVGGTWDVHGFIPENIQWGTNSLYLASAVITGGTWNGGTIGAGYGGTGLTSFSAANNALYSTGTTSLTAGTLPIAAGGTGQTSASTAINALVPSQAGNSGKALVTDGTSVSWGAAFVSGMIIMWSGSIITIPSGWLLCNGSSGTPDLRDRFVIGAGNAYAVNATGGTADSIVVSHTHTASSSVSDPGHFHLYGGSRQVQAGGDNSGPYVGGNSFYNTSSQTTGITVGTTVTTTGSSGTGQNLPPYYALCYIMKS